MAALATGDDLIARYDAEVVGELATDSRVTPVRSEIPTLANVTKALLRASGQFEVAVRVGKLYSPAQLANLDENSTEHVKDIVCCFAMAKLLDRRPGVHKELSEAIREKCSASLERLESGKDVLGIVDDDSHADASLPSLEGPTPVQITDRGFIASRMSGRHVPAPDDAHDKQFR